MNATSTWSPHAIVVSSFATLATLSTTPVISTLSTTAIVVIVIIIVSIRGWSWAWAWASTTVSVVKKDGIVWIASTTGHGQPVSIHDEWTASFRRKRTVGSPWWWTRIKSNRGDFSMKRIAIGRKLVVSGSDTLPQLLIFLLADWPITSECDEYVGFKLCWRTAVARSVLLLPPYSAITEELWTKSIILGSGRWG